MPQQEWPIGHTARVFNTDLDRYSQGHTCWKIYRAFSAQIVNTPEKDAEAMDEHFDPVVRRLIDLLKKAMPDCSEDDIFWGYPFLSGALLLTQAQTGRIDKLSGGLCKSDDIESVKEPTTRCMAAGFSEVCDQPENADPEHL